MTGPGRAVSRRLALAPEPVRAAAEPSRSTAEPDRDSPETARATLRATASQLADQHISNREIGRRLGISKDKVKRLLDELAAEQAAGASHDEPSRATAEPPAASGSPLPLPPGADRMAIDLTPKMRADLDVLLDGGLLEDDAIAEALSFVAGAVRHAWTAGICPHGILPHIAWQVGPPRTNEAAPHGMDR